MPWIYNQILPRLRAAWSCTCTTPSCRATTHGDWVFAGEGWNEQYLVQSFLVRNSAFEVLFGTYWMNRGTGTCCAARSRPERQGPDRSSSLWIRSV